MAKKQERIARVRYDRSYKIGNNELREAFVIETYDQEFGWCMNKAFPLEEAVRWPKAGTNFVHIDCLMNVFQLLNLDYTVHLSKAGEK